LSLSFCRGNRDIGRWTLSTTASCGARTFLSPVLHGDDSPDSPGNDRPAGSQNLSSIIRCSAATLSCRQFPVAAWTAGAPLWMIRGVLLGTERWIVAIMAIHSL